MLYALLLELFIFGGTVAELYIDNRAAVIRHLIKACAWELEPDFARDG